MRSCTSFTMSVGFTKIQVKNMKTFRHQSFPTPFDARFAGRGPPPWTPVTHTCCVSAFFTGAVRGSSRGWRRTTQSLTHRERQRKSWWCPDRRRSQRQRPETCFAARPLAHFGQRPLSSGEAWWSYCTLEKKKKYSLQEKWQRGQRMGGTQRLVSMTGCRVCGLQRKDMLAWVSQPC